MLHSTESVILKTAPFSDADLIVTAFTCDYGLIKTFAKSPRKTKSRFGSSLEPLTYSKIAFWGKEDSNLPRLTQSDIIKPFQSIRERLKSFLMAMEMVELTLNLLPEREANRGVFNLLIHVLNAIEQECSNGNSNVFNYIFYKVRLLDMAGYGPMLSGCARCGKSGYDFYILHGSVICGDCAKGMDAPIRLSPGVTKLYDAMRRWDISKIGRLKPSGMLLSELAGMLDTHIQHTISKPLRTKAFRFV